MPEDYPQPGQNVFSAEEEKAMRVESAKRNTAAAPAVDFSQTAYGRAWQDRGADPNSGAKD
jgi:hypothetical protein